MITFFDQMNRFDHYIPEIKETQIQTSPVGDFRKWIQSACAALLLSGAATADDLNVNIHLNPKDGEKMLQFQALPNNTLGSFQTHEDNSWRGHQEWLAPKINFRETQNLDEVQIRGLKVLYDMSDQVRLEFHALGFGQENVPYFNGAQFDATMPEKRGKAAGFRLTFRY